MLERAVERLAATFRRPPANFGPIPAWWWSAERLAHDRLEWQLRQFRAAGLSEVMICSFGYRQPVGGFPPDDPPFFSEEWWSCFRHTAAVADELGMRLWFWDHLGTFGDPTPEVILRSHPEFVARDLDRVTAGAELPADAVVLRDDGGHVYFTRPRVVDDRHSGLGYQEYMFRYDLYDRAATDLIVDTLHGEYERRLGDAFGRVIAGSFHDELRPFSSWAAELPDAFRRRSGRALPDCLPALFDRAVADPAARIAYHRALADLAEASFFEPLHRWHDERGLIVVADQIRRARTGDPLDAQRAYHDYPRTHRWFNGIGNDHNGEAKLHSSLAHLYGRPRVFLEGFHSSGWGTTLEDTLQWLLPWLQQGSTLYGPGTTWYGSIRAGWLEDGTPDTSWRQPYWRHYPGFAETIARLCWLFAQGRHVCDVALFYPSSAMQAELTVPDGELDATLNRMPWIFTPAATAAPSPVAEGIGQTFWGIAGGVSWRWQGTRYRDDRRRWTGALEQAGQDFDVVDEDSLDRADVADGRLAVAGESYRTLVFPMATFVPRRSLEQAHALARAGGDVFFVGCLPRGTTEGGVDDPELRRLLGGLLGSAPADVSGSAAEALHEHPGGGVVGYVPRAEELAAVLSRRLAPEVSGEARALHRHVDGLDLYLIVPRQLAPPPPEREGRLWRLMEPAEAEALVRSVIDHPPPPERLTVTVRQTGPVGQWDPFTGEIHRARVVARDERSTTVEVDLTSAPVGILVFGHEAAQAPPAMPAVVWRELGGEWTSELVQTQDNRHGDFAWPPSAGAPPVEVRRLDYLDGLRGAPDDGVPWAPVLCGFASLVEVRGPHRDGSPTAAGIEDWRAYLCSTRFGGHKNVGHQSGVGLQGVVPEQFVAFGFARPGDYYFLRTEVLVPAATSARLRVTSTGAIVAWVDGQEVAAGHDEVCVPVPLRSGANRLVLRIGEDEDRPLRGVRLRAGFHVLPADATAPYGHPLPDVPAWLNLAGPPAVMPGLALDPHPEERPHEAWFRCVVPPGADHVTVARASRVPFLEARLDGARLDLAWDDGADVSLARADLPDPERVGRRLYLRCELPVGVLPANAFPEPLRFRCRVGRIRLGDWRDVGLGSYSGGIRYRAAFDLDRPVGSLWIDLGRVRGSVEVTLNDAPCGVRSWSPYRFDLTPAARQGTNHLTVTVFNTLGSLFGEGHPSPFGYGSQAAAWMMGPVRLYIS